MPREISRTQDPPTKKTKVLGPSPKLSLPIHVRLKVTVTAMEGEMERDALRLEVYSENNFKSNFNMTA